MKKFILTTFCSSLLVSLSMFASDIDSIQTSVLNNYMRQAEAFPQEKIHLHIDKPAYLSGERIWFKAHLVNAAVHTPFSVSKYVYAELIDAECNVISRVKVRKEESYSGYINIAEDLPEGNYFLRAYTLFMKNTKGEYDSYLPISISDPASAKISIHPTFEFLTKDKVRVTLSITNTENKAKFTPTLLRLSQNDEIIYYRTNKDGNFHFDFKFDKKLKEQAIGVECDRYRKKIFIPHPAHDFQISFYPEGGNLIADAENTIAFKALDNEGRSLTIEGKIVDENGNQITNFKTWHEGMGSFIMRAKKNKKYFATVSYQNINKQFELPQAIASSGLRVIQKDNKLTILLSGNENIDHNESLYLVAHTRGFLHSVEKYDRKANKMELDTRNFPSGILHLLLINKNKETLGERLVFCMNDDLAKVEQENPDEAFGTRKRIPICFNLSDIKGQLLESDNISVSVVDCKDVDPNINPSILSSLLLTSDLRGHITSPNYYFENSDSDRKQSLDLIMLTHGWRRYNIPHVIKGQIEYPTEPIELGQVISGKVKSLAWSKPIPNSKVLVISTNTNYNNATTTDGNGAFLFQGFEYADSARYILRSMNEKGSDRVELIIDNDSFPNANNLYPARFRQTLSEMSNDNLIRYINKAEQKYYLENGMRTVYLKPIEVRANNMRKKYSTPYSILADNKYSLEDIEASAATSLSELLWNIPGARVSDTDVYFSRFGGKPAFIYIDGIYLYREGDIEMSESGSLYTHPIQNEQRLLRGLIDNIVPFDNIESVEAFKTLSSTAIFSTRGNGGAIMINTKRGLYQNESKEAYNIKNIYPLGYQIPVEFYSPKYEDIADRSSSDPDLRTTIYWNPKLKSNDSGKVEFDFYSADSAGSYMMTVEGVTNDGQIIRYQDEIVIK